MGILTKDAILSSDDLRTEDVPCPEWGGDVRVRNLTGSERDQWEMWIVGPEGTERNTANIRARLVSLVAIDEAGARLFSDDDIKALGFKSAAALDRVFSVAQRLSGLTEASKEAMEADLSAGQEDGSASD